MKLIVLYLAQVVFMIAAFAAITSVFIVINNDAMTSTVAQLIDETATRAAEEAAAPLAVSVAHVLSLADATFVSPNIGALDPSTQWLETPSMAKAPSFTIQEAVPITPLLTQTLLTLRNSIYGDYFYQLFEMPDNSSQWSDSGCGRATSVVDRNLGYYCWRPSFQRQPPYGEVPYMTYTFNFSTNAGGVITSTFIDHATAYFGYLCPKCEDPDTQLSPIHAYQAVVRALPPATQATGSWTIYGSYYDPIVGLQGLLTFSVPLEFTTDAKTGAKYCKRGLSLDVNAAFLAKALDLAKADGVDLAMFFDRQGVMTGWTLPQPPVDTASQSVLSAGATGTDFDTALTLMRSAGWCNGSVTGFAGCVAPRPRATVGDADNVYTIRKVVSVDASFSIVVRARRSAFFGPGMQAQTVGIVVSVVTCLVCLASSIALWLTTAAPLRRLITNMEFASTFASDVDPETDSCISEIQEANEAFLTMHDELQRAKPFIPMHLQNDMDHRRAALRGLEKSIDEEPVEDVTLSHSRELGSVRSGRASTKRSAGGTSSRHSGGGASLRPLEHRTVAVLVGNLTGSLTLFKESSVSAQEKHAIVIKAVVTAVSQQRGVVDSLLGDHFIATFNSSTRCAQPSAKAVKAAFEILRLLRNDGGLTAPWRRMTFGVGVGSAFIGTLGSDELRAHATITRATRHAVSLQRLARAMSDVDGPSEAPVCVVTAPVVGEVNTFAHYRFIAPMALPPDGAVMPVASVFAPADEGASRSAVEGEWLYTVGARAETNPYIEHNQDFEKRCATLRDGTAMPALDEEANRRLLATAVGTVYRVA